MAIAELPAVTIPIMGMVANVLSLGGSQRLFVGMTFIRSVVFSFIIGIALELGLDGWRIAEIGVQNVAAWVVIGGNLLIYVCLSYSFFHLVNIGEASIRVRILREINNAGTSIQEAALLRIYSEQTILGIRLERMQAAGIVVKLQGKYILRSKNLLWLARLFRGLKYFLLRRPSEFE